MNLLSDKIPSTKSTKILKELDINARKSATKIGEKLGISKQVVNYHITHMIKDGIIKEFIAYIDSQKLGYTFYNVLIKLKYTSVKEREKIVDSIKSLQNVAWLASFNGEWHFIVSILARNVGEFSYFLDKVLNEIKDRLLDYNLFIVINASQLGYKKIHSESARDYHYPANIGQKEPVNLSHTDLKVLKTIANNARLPASDIAKKVKISVDPVRYSIRKLQKEKVIQAYKPLINVSKIGYLWHVMFLRLKSVSEEERKKLTNFLRALPEVFYVVQGVGNYNLMIEFQTKSLEEFEKVKDSVSEKFSDFIADEKTVQLTEEYKCTYFPGNLD